MESEIGIVITGCGWVLPHGCGSIAELAGMEDESAPGGEADGAYVAVPDGALDAYEHLAKEVKHDKGAWMTAIAVEHALRHVSIDRSALVPERTGLVLGSSLAGQLGMIGFAGEVREQSARFVSPINFPQTVGNYIAGAIARAYAFRGPNATLAGGAASGLDAIIAACDVLASDQADVMLAGATETVTDMLADTFGTATPRMIEGSCLVMLERSDDSREQHVLFDVRAWTQTAGSDRNDASDLGSLGEPLAIAVAAALRHGLQIPDRLRRIVPDVTQTAGASIEVRAGAPTQHTARITLSSRTQ